MISNAERASIIITDLDTFNKLDRVAWLAAALDQFEREIRLNITRKAVAAVQAAAQSEPDGERES